MKPWGKFKKSRCFSGWDVDARAATSVEPQKSGSPGGTSGGPRFSRNPGGTTACRRVRNSSSRRRRRRRGVPRMGNERRGEPYSSRMFVVWRPLKLKELIDARPKRPRWAAGRAVPRRGTNGGGDNKALTKVERLNGWTLKPHFLTPL